MIEDRDKRECAAAERRVRVASRVAFNDLEDEALDLNRV